MAFQTPLVPGIGPAHQRDLLRHFGSLKKIREASLESLLAVPGITRKAASAVHDYFAAQSGLLTKGHLTSHL